MTLYELFHAIEHLPYESFWKRKVEHPRFGRYWEMIYAFHVRHHANVLCNESVSGFFGYPLPDLVFKTYMCSRVVLLDNVPAFLQDFETPVPCWFIRVLDRMALWSMDKQKAARKLC